MNMEARTERPSVMPKEKKGDFLTRALNSANKFAFQKKLDTSHSSDIVDRAISDHIMDLRLMDQAREEARRNILGFNYEDLRCLASARKRQLQKLALDKVVFGFFYEQVREARREKSRRNHQAVKEYVDSYGANVYFDPQGLLDKNGRSLWGAAELARKASIVKKMRGDKAIEGERQLSYAEILAKKMKEIEAENHRLEAQIKTLFQKKAPEYISRKPKIEQQLSNLKRLNQFKRALRVGATVIVILWGLRLYKGLRAPPPVKAFSDRAAVVSLSAQEMVDLDIGGQDMPTQTPESTLTATATATIEPTQEPMATSILQPTITETIKPEKTNVNQEIYQKIYSAVEAKRKERVGQDVDYLKRINPELNQDKISFLLVGMDARPGQKISRADAPVIATLDLKTNKVSIIRIPRDLHAPLKRVLEKNKTYAKYADKAFRVNATTVFGDSDDMRRTVEEATGLSMDFCFFWDFKGFQKLVDSVGGITVKVEKAIHEETYPDGNNVMILDIPAGTQTMDGVTALTYARTRHADTDLLRGRRQTQIVEVFAQKLIERIKSNPISAVNFISTLEELRRDGHLSVCGEFSVLNLLQLAQNLVSENLRNFRKPELRSIDFWRKVISGQRLKADRYQLFVGDPKATGEPNSDSEDPLDYWTRVRAEIEAMFK